MLATITRRVNSRLEANTFSDKLVPREVGETVTIVKLIVGEMLRGNRIWAVDDKGIVNWSGALKIDFEKIITTQPNVFKLFQLSKIWNSTTGENVKICLIDSGVKEVSSLTNTVEQFDNNFVNGSLHGTYMAEIIAAMDFDNSIFGIAPNTKVISHKISPSDLTPDILFKILNENKDVDIFNFSLNNRNREFLQENLETNLQNLLKELDITNKILVAATGNEGIKKLQFKNFPAAINSFVSVAGLTISSGNISDLFSASNLWDDTHILAPASAYFDTDRNEYHDFETGTSVASAFVSGVFSLIISYCKKKGISNYKNVIKKYLEDLPTIESSAIGGTIKSKQILPDSLIKFISNI